jgi:hypothetical protein
MKGKGILVLFALLFLLPLTVDLILFFFLKESLIDWNMTKMMFSGYLGLLPLFILYLIIAFTILYLIKQTRKNRSKRK